MPDGCVPATPIKALRSRNFVDLGWLRLMNWLLRTVAPYARKRYAWRLSTATVWPGYQKPSARRQEKSFRSWSAIQTGEAAYCCGAQTVPLVRSEAEQA